ncbi:high affinity copper uptake protein 1 isoform X2 [Frankliniella occidentalis]|uniref:Copper transport protein n=1 Tax=Frankliniella occidentalis TaxID=133901 RepID=A0A6J1TFL2_FRAOC|nr:high affinity copper uptake protein 1 isoform X2 [Frankliniella occidentalis]
MMDHSMMDHSAMNHSMMEHSAMDHSMMDHSMMDHSAMNHSMMDHSAMKNAAVDHSTMNHSMMDHSMMDHSVMDHSMSNHSMVGHASHSGMDHSGMSMSMTFHFGVMETVLFKGWQVGGVSTLLLSCVGIFFMAFIYEGIKYYRENLLWKTYNALHYRAVDGNAVPDAENHKTPKMFSQKHVVQTCLHIVQLTVSYLLMLIFMTYNVWLCLAVVAGSASGYFVFGWKRTVVVDMTETCH